MGRFGVRCAAAVTLAVLGGGLEQASWASAAPVTAGAPATAGALVASAHAAPMARVSTGGATLSVRRGPATTFRRVRRLADGSALRVSCQIVGERIAGRVRTTSIWNRLGANAYVSDAYVAWRSPRPALARCDRASVRTGYGPLNVRNNASTLNAKVGQLSNGARVGVICRLAGETVSGSQRRTAIWDRLSTGRYISDAFVEWSPSRPPLAWCTLPGPRSPDDHAKFIVWSARFAQQTQIRFQVPASVTVAQAILESGWGGSGLTRTGNAYFGMKCFGTPGPIAAGCRPFATHECAGSTCYATSALFRMYHSPAASFYDHARQLARLDRYRPAFAYSNDPNRFAIAIHKAGYATSPTYAANLISLMRQYNLYRFDRPSPL